MIIVLWKVSFSLFFSLFSPFSDSFFFLLVLIHPDPSPNHLPFSLIEGRQHHENAQRISHRTRRPTDPNTSRSKSQKRKLKHPPEAEEGLKKRGGKGGQRGNREEGATRTRSESPKSGGGEDGALFESEKREDRDSSGGSERDIAGLSSSSENLESSVRVVEGQFKFQYSKDRVTKVCRNWASYSFVNRARYFRFFYPNSEVFLLLFLCFFFVRPTPIQTKNK